jgi:hypothetical protein
MHQLSMTDAFMRAAENERQTLQVGSLSILAPPADGEAPVTDGASATGLAGL